VRPGRHWGRWCRPTKGAFSGAKKYKRTEDRKDTRAGSYDRKLQTKAGEVTLTVPKLRSLPIETAIIERYRRRESSVEEALIEMYLAGVSVRPQSGQDAP
jgi:putative transposase